MPIERREALPMPTIDAEIDDLYRLPLADFTAARNQLIKRAGTRVSEIKALQKPSMAAWAVNQLYWHRRQLFEALAAASVMRRQTHVRRIGGKTAGVDAADSRHREALEAALKATLEFIRDGAEAASPATVAAVTQTLEAIPSPEIQGRLARPVEAAGLAVLMGLMASQPSAVGHHATAEPSTAAKPAVAARQRQERAQVERELREAEAREHGAGRTLAKARQAVERADQQIERLDDQLREARTAAGMRRDEMDRATAAATEAASDRARIERRLRDLA
jgi:hypothetical protein